MPVFRKGYKGAQASTTGSTAAQEPQYRLGASGVDPRVAHADHVHTAGGPSGGGGSSPAPIQDVLMLMGG